MDMFKNIAFVLDPKFDATSASLARAISLARNNQANLTVLHVQPDPSLSTKLKMTEVERKNLENRIREYEIAKLDHLISALQPEIAVKGQLLTGKRYIEIIHAVQKNDFDLIIKEAQPSGWLERNFGSDDMHLLRKCPCPIWLVKQNETSDNARIMVAVDFDDDEGVTDQSELSHTLLGIASSLSVADLAELHVVNVYDVPHAGFISLWVEDPDKVERELFEAEYLWRERKMTILLEDLKQNIGGESFNYLSPNTHLIKGNPDRELPKIAEAIKADLVVMGTVARTGIAGAVIGNTAEAILSQLNCSVLAIKPRGFVSPVSHVDHRT